MLGPIFSFTFESRQALFWATTEAAARQNPEALAAYIAAGFVRSSSLTRFIADEGADLAGLLRALNPSPPGKSEFDALDAAGGFVNVRMPPNVAAFFEKLSSQFEGAPEQSVTPAQVLLALLEFDADMRSTFEAHGIRLQVLRRHVHGSGGEV